MSDARAYRLEAGRLAHEADILRAALAAANDRADRAEARIGAALEGAKAAVRSADEAIEAAEQRASLAERQAGELREEHAALALALAEAERPPVEPETPHAARSAAYWKTRADEEHASRLALDATIDGTRAELATVWQAFAGAQADIAAARDINVELQARLTATATADELAKAADALAVAQANIVEVRQLADAERHRANRLADLFGACVAWRDARRLPARDYRRKNADEALSNTVARLCAELPG